MFQRHELALFRLFQQLAKGAEAVGGLVEAGLAALQRLLDHRAPDFVFHAALGDQSFEGFYDHVNCLLALVGLPLLRRLVRGTAWGGTGRVLRRTLFLLFLLAHQVVVEQKFVAVRGEQIEVDFLTPTPMTTLLFSRSLDTSGEKSE